MGTRSAHVIVLGNEKGGSGKSTTAFHLACLLMYQGFKVATVDVDSRQQTFTHYVENRRNWAMRHDLTVPHPIHYHLPVSSGDSVSQNERREFEVFRRAIAEVESRVDYLVIDTPGFDTNLTRLAHSLADTLVTPINDSLIDMDVLAQIDPVSGQTRALSHYARLVQRARKERLAIDGKTVDWTLVRNRIAMLSSRNMRLVQSALDQIALRLGARVIDGISERVIFRSLFPIGMTVFDPLDEVDETPMTNNANDAARSEYVALARGLNLPWAHKVLLRQDARAEWERQSANGATFEHMAPQVDPSANLASNGSNEDGQPRPQLDG
ncbi:MAG: AAA family ATPase [Hyphomicrobiaceae bacterium]|nr:AAA family ATPase [Hyphomicrobiaceae bacterium]